MKSRVTKTATALPFYLDFRKHSLSRFSHVAASPPLGFNSCSDNLFVAALKRYTQSKMQLLGSWWTCLGQDFYEAPPLAEDFLAAEGGKLILLQWHSHW